MQCEQRGTICLNHALTWDVEYKPKGSDSWVFKAENITNNLTTFCLRFKTEETAKEFKRAIEVALKTKNRNCGASFASKCSGTAAASNGKMVKTKAQCKCFDPTQTETGH